MAGKPVVEVDKTQVKKATQALQAFLKAKSKKDTLLLDDSQQVSLLFTLWRIPKNSQTIRIPLPHGQRKDTEEVCLFTRDEPNMTSEQTQKFYKRLLEEKGVKHITEIIPYKVLKTEYKPYEAKRRLLGNFDMFLSDDRIRRLLPSHLGKHFYQRKKEPLCVNLQTKQLAQHVHGVIQGTNLKVNSKGSCCMARVGHSGMTVDELTENIEAAVRTVVAKIRMNGPAIKIVHLKSEKSVALPIYTSDLQHLSVFQRKKKTNTPKEEVKTDDKKEMDAPVEEEKDVVVEEEEEDDREADDDDDDDEEIPQLVPIETPSKKPKMEKNAKKKKLQKVPKPAAAKKAPLKQKKMGKKEVKRKVPKVK